MYMFYPIFHCGLKSTAHNITDNLCSKQGNSSIKSVVYNQERFQIKSGLKWHVYGIQMEIYFEGILHEPEVCTLNDSNFGFLCM